MNGNAQQRTQEVDFLRDARDLYGWLVLLIRCLAAPCEIWVRQVGTIGERYLVITAPCGLLLHFLMTCWIGAQRPMSDEVFAVTVYIAMTIAHLVFHRIQRARLRSQGYRYHSQYIGESIFHRPNGPRPTTYRRAILEALWTWGFALIYLPLSFGLAATLLVAGFALVLNAFLLQTKEDAITRSLTDAMIDARSNAERI